MMNDERYILPGDRVLVFDSQLFVNDKITPLNVTCVPATVICRYGLKSSDDRIYPDLVDVRFDHRPLSVSHGHFTLGVKLLT